MAMKGIGKQVNITVMSRRCFRPQTSLRDPTSGADKNDRKPLKPIINPFIKNVWSGKVSFKACQEPKLNQYNSWKVLTVIIGAVRRPQEKNSKKITTRTWSTEGLAILSLCWRRQRRDLSPPRDVCLLVVRVIVVESDDELKEYDEEEGLNEVEILWQTDPTTLTTLLFDDENKTILFFPIDMVQRLTDWTDRMKDGWRATWEHGFGDNSLANNLY